MMSAFSAQSIAANAQLNLIQVVDDGRAQDDPFKLSTRLRKQVDADCAGLAEYDALALTMESSRTGKSMEARELLETLERLVREGYAGIAAIRASEISEPERMEVFTAYGWARGVLGRLPDSRVVGLARLGVRTHTNVAAAFQYPAELVRELEVALQQFDAVSPQVGTGKRQVAVKQRSLALEACEETLTQVRHWYCAATREGSKTKELALIGFQPRRPRRSSETVALHAEQKKARRAELAARREEEKNKKQAENLKRVQARHEKLKSQYDASLQELARLAIEPDATGNQPLPLTNVGPAPIRTARPSNMAPEGTDPAQLSS